MAFEKFTEVGRSFAPKVSINRKGMIGFNQGAAHRFKLNQYKFCVMYYDRSESKIGIELINDAEAEGAIRLRNRPIGSDIGAKAFLTYYDILPKGTFMYVVTCGPEDNWVTIDLKSARERKESRNGTDGQNDEEFEDGGSEMPS